jgi:hypothetical protein
VFAWIERRGELYKAYIIGWDRVEKKTYFTQRGIRNFMVGRALDMIVLKNVELEEETREMIMPCLRGKGKLVEVE